MAANRLFVPKHNVVASIDPNQPNTQEYHGLFAYLARSRIHFALTHSPVLYADYLQEFWRTAINVVVQGIPAIRATVNGVPITFTAGMLREILHLGTVAEEDGPVEFSEELIHGCFLRMGFVGNLAHPFHKHGFRGKWRFLGYMMLVCMSNRRAGFDAVNLQVASQLVALVLNKPYSFSQYIFNNLRTQVNAVGAARFLMMPRFVMTIINHFVPGLPPQELYYVWNPCLNDFSRI